MAPKHILIPDLILFTVGPYCIVFTPVFKISKAFQLSVLVKKENCEKVLWGKHTRNRYFSLLLSNQEQFHRCSLFQVEAFKLGK